MKLLQLLVTVSLLAVHAGANNDRRRTSGSRRVRPAVDPRYPKTVSKARYDNTEDSYGCGVGKFKCDNGDCIAACDYNDGKVFHCADGSDEPIVDPEPPQGRCGIPAISPELGAQSSRRGRSQGQRRTSGKANRVDNGVEAKPHSWPWQVYLGGCGGVLVSERLVITAAHCVGHMSSVHVRAGLHDKSQQAPQSRMATAMRHPKFNPDASVGKGEYDIAFIEINPPFELNDHVHPVCLPTALPAPRKTCYATGWGTDKKQFESDVQPQNLTQARIIMYDQNTPFPKDYCGNPELKLCGYGPSVNNGEEGANNESVCSGDTGGPLMCQTDAGVWELQGITHAVNRAKCGSDADGTGWSYFTQVFALKSYIQTLM